MCPVVLKYKVIVMKLYTILTVICCVTFLIAIPRRHMCVCREVIVLNICNYISCILDCQILSDGVNDEHDVRVFHRDTFFMEKVMTRSRTVCPSGFYANDFIESYRKIKIMFSTDYFL